MAVNYFGKRRLEKIFFNYISDRKNLIKIVKSDLKKYSKEQVMNYHKYRGLEWFKIKIYDEKNNTSTYFELYTSTYDKGCRISMTERHIEHTDDFEEDDTTRKVFYGHAYYTEDFYPYAG